MRPSIQSCIFILLLMVLVSCSKNPVLEKYGEFPEFNLTNQSGIQFDSSELNGKIVLSNFIFTNCVEYCSALTPLMLNQQKRLDSNKDLDNKYALISFSVDPEYDTPEILKNYSGNFGVDHSTWNFLTGDPEKIKDIVTSGLKLSFGQVNKKLEHTHQDGSIHLHEYDVFHSNRIVLADKDGNIRAYFDGINGWDGDQVYNHILDLANE